MCHVLVVLVCADVVAVDHEVLVVVAALYVTISFGDPGYVLAGPSAFSPEPATLASMAHTVAKEIRTLESKAPLVVVKKAKTRLQTHLKLTN